MGVSIFIPALLTVNMPKETEPTRIVNGTGTRRLRYFPVFNLFHRRLWLPHKLCILVRKLAVDHIRNGLSTAKPFA